MNSRLLTRVGCARLHPTGFPYIVYLFQVTFDDWAMWKAAEFSFGQIVGFALLSFPRLDGAANGAEASAQENASREIGTAVTI